VVSQPALNFRIVSDEVDFSRGLAAGGSLGSPIQRRGTDWLFSSVSHLPELPVEIGRSAIKLAILATMRSCLRLEAASFQSR
jgi:hypothetical protein